MYKNCRIINKNTNSIFFGQIDTEFEGKDFYENLEIPDDGKEYIYENGQVVEKQPDIALIAAEEQEIINQQARQFLQSTDWQILRHIGQLTLNMLTTLSESEYQELEQQRQTARNQII